MLTLTIHDMESIIGYWDISLVWVTTGFTQIRWLMDLMSPARFFPQEKLLVLPCLANLDDPRFEHLYETLEAEQPDLMSESMLHLQGCGRVN